MSQDASGRHVYFILVRYPGKLIAEMRRLSKGAKVIGRVIRSDNGVIELSLTEVNGVAVTFASADVLVRKQNKFAKWISYYVVHVPKGSESRFDVAFEPVRICGDTRAVSLNINRSEKGIGDYLLGAKLTKSVTVKGFDEIGRPVSVGVVF